MFECERGEVLSFALPGFQTYLCATIEKMSLSVTVLHNVQGGG